MRMSINTKLTTAFIGVGATASLAIGAAAIHSSANSLMEEQKNSMQRVRDTKYQGLQAYFKNLEAVTVQAAETPDVAKSIVSMSTLFRTPPTLAADKDKLDLGYSVLTKSRNVPTL